jgi:exocyst complex component 7
MQGTSTLGNGSAANRWDNIMLTCAGKGRESGRDEGADGAIMTETILSIRGTLMQVFPKFIEDIRIMPGMREGEVPSTTVNEITYSGLKFIKQLVDYRDVVSPLLQTLGAGNWMMSRGTAPVLSLGFEGEEEGILTSYLNDVLATVLSALEARSRAIRQLSTASIFLLK